MLRNSYLESYIKEKKKISEYENDMLIHDGNHILQQQRPLSIRGIRKLPENMLSTFVNDIMCNKKMGYLLYPATFPKHVALYLKQQNYVYKITTLNKNKNYYEYLNNVKENNKNDLDDNSGNSNEDGNISSGKIINYQKQEEIDDIKNNIKSFKYNKSTKMKKLRIKNKKFFKNQPLIDKKLTKLSFLPVNDIRIRGYHKAFENCLHRSFLNKNFNLPNIELKADDVYSRLYNNVIVKNKTRNKYINKSDDEDFINNNKKYNNMKYMKNNNSLKELNSMLSSTSNINLNNNNNINYTQKTLSPKNQLTSGERKELIFHISNINKSLNGKEFTQKITPKMYQRCLSSLSGGPPLSLKRSQSCFLKNKLKSNNNKKKKKYINYYAKLTSKNCFLKQKSKPEINSYHNKSNTIDTEVINNLILANSNSRSELINVKRFRDVNYNTNLHMAVLKNSYKFVDYFIKKKLNINKKNKNGDTPLHLAIQQGDYDIIKLLLDNGANIKIKNKKGITPFDLADKEMRLAFNLEDLFNNFNKY